MNADQAITFACPELNAEERSELAAYIERQSLRHEPRTRSSGPARPGKSQVLGLAPMHGRVDQRQHPSVLLAENPPLVQRPLVAMLSHDADSRALRFHFLLAGFQSPPELPPTRSLNLQRVD